MKITPVGKAALLLIFLTLWNAVNGGLNTLYMVYSALAAAIVVSWVSARIASIAIEVQTGFPDQIFAGDTISLKLNVRNRFWIPLFGASVASREERNPIGDIPARGEIDAIIPYRFTRRGLTAITDLRVEFSFPFNLFIFSREVRTREIIVFPSPAEFAGRPRLDATMMEESARPRRGAGDEFYGIREYAPGDDTRLISWKISAKLGRPFIREFAEMVGDRITVRADGSPPGEATEERIREAAAMARYFIDEGAEVRLVTDEGDTGFGRGLLHLGMMLERLALLGEGRKRRGTGNPQGIQKGLPAAGEKTHLFFALWAMIAATVAGLWISQGLDMATKVLTSLAVPAGFMLDRINRHPIPQSVFNVLNVAVIAAVLFVDIPLSGLLPGLTHLLSWAIINRMISKKTQRDSRTIPLICFLLFLLISWQTIDPVYSAAFAAFFSAAGAWAALSFGSLSKLNFRRGMALAVSLLFTLSIAGLFFAATPRVSNPRFAKMMRQLGLANMVIPELSIVKLADRVTLGVFDDVRVNSRRVMQVKISGVKIPEEAALYVRGGALDRFDGKEWTRSRFDFPYDHFGQPVMSRAGRAFYESRGKGYATSAGGTAEPLVKAEFFVYPMATSVIFSVGDPTTIEGDVFIPTFDLSGTVYSASSFEAGGRYVVASKSFDIALDDLVHGYDDVLSKLYLYLPEGREMEVIRRISKDVAGGAGDAEAKALAIERYFHENFVYSYLGKHGKQSLEDFLTKSRAANCEYYATAMALMLRAEGIPARLAIGYVSTDRKQVGEYFDVRNSDGHAWVETYIPGRGWVSFDPTPDVVGYPSESFFLGRDLYVYFLNMQMSWYRYVIGYDFYLQQDVLASVVAVWRNVAAAIAIALVLAVVAWAAALLLIGRINLRGKGRDVAVEASVAWLEAERLLSKFGFMRQRWQTPLEFASGVAAREPGLSAAVRMVRAYYGWRYRGAGSEEATGAFIELKAALRRHGEREIRHQAQS